MNKLVLYREVQASKHNLAIFSDIDSDHFEEMKFITEVDPIEITEKDIAEVIAKYVSYSALAICDTSTREIAAVILSKLKGDG